MRTVERRTENGEVFTSEKYLSATKEHLLLYDHSFDSDDGSMLPIKNNKNKITSIDSFIYKRDQALLNKSNHFLQLKIFAE